VERPLWREVGFSVVAEHIQRSLSRVWVPRDSWALSSCLLYMCVWSMQCNVEFGDQRSICSGTKGNHGKPWPSWLVAWPSGCKLTSSQQSGISSHLYCYFTEKHLQVTFTNIFVCLYFGWAPNHVNTRWGRILHPGRGTGNRPYWGSREGQTWRSILKLKSRCYWRSVSQPVSQSASQSVSQPVRLGVEPTVGLATTY
jgi:hypothetical protein